MGAAVIDADRIGREVVENNPQVLARLVRRFGEDILTRSGRLNRRKLALRAFQNDAAKLHLNRIVHPPLLKELKRQTRQAARVNNVVVIDAALLLDWNLDRIVDLTIVIRASQSKRLERLMDRGISRTDALARQRGQLPLVEYRLRADYVLLNNDSPDRLRDKLMKIVRRIDRKRID